MNSNQADILYRRYRRNRDAASLGALVDALDEDLRRRAGGPHADDVVQATWLVVIEAADRFDEARPFLPWLHGILERVGRSWGRAADRRPDADRLDPGTPVSPHHGAAVAEEARLVAEKLDALPIEVQPVVRLSLEAGLAPREIATLVGRPVNRVRVQLHRGLARLKKLLPAGVGVPAVLVATAPASRAGQRVRLLRLAARPKKRMVAAGAAAWLMWLAFGALATGVIVVDPFGFRDASTPEPIGASGEGAAEQDEEPGRDPARRTARVEGGASANGATGVARTHPAATPDSAPTPKMEEVAGRLVVEVTDEAGAAVSGVCVSVGVPLEMEAVIPASFVIGTALSAANGRVSVDLDAGLAKFAAYREISSHPAPKQVVIQVDEPLPASVRLEVPLGRARRLHRLVIPSEVGWFEVVHRRGDVVPLNVKFSAEVTPKDKYFDGHPAGYYRARSHDAVDGVVRFLVGLDRRFEVSVSSMEPSGMTVSGPKEAGGTRRIVYAPWGANRFSGRLVDRAGRPLAGVVVRAFAEDSGLLVDESVDSIWRARTDDAGRFRFEAAFRHSGPDIELRIEGDAAGRRWTAEPLPFFLECPFVDVDLGDVVMDEAPLIASGVVVDGDGRPVAAAEVFVDGSRQDEPNTIRSAWLKTWTGKDGRFVLARPLPGTLTEIGVRKAGFAEPEERPLTVGASGLKLVLGRP